MGRLADATRGLVNGLLPARLGTGPLIQRDYWAVIERCRLDPPDLVELVATRFPDFAPEQIAAFRRTGWSRRPLAVGDELAVRIRAVGKFRVRVLHRDANSLTIATLKGHPEAGRITFGAYRNDYGDVIFHIRSRARSGTVPSYLGFLALGEAMQTETWAEFVNRVALTAGDGIIGVIHAERRELPAGVEAAEDARAPTFIARER